MFCTLCGAVHYSTFDAWCLGCDDRSEANTQWSLAYPEAEWNDDTHWFDATLSLPERA